MAHPFWFWCIIIVFCSIMSYLVEGMIKDKNAIIRFLGYAIAVVMAVVILHLILNRLFEINLLQILPF